MATHGDMELHNRSKTVTTDIHEDDYGNDLKQEGKDGSVAPKQRLDVRIPPRSLYQHSILMALAEIHQLHSYDSFWCQPASNMGIRCSLIPSRSAQRWSRMSLPDHVLHILADLARPRWCTAPSSPGLGLLPWPVPLLKWRR